jgi:hypothetical protein
MKSAPHKDVAIPTMPLPIAPARPAEPSLVPIHWPEAFKLIVLWAGPWAITLGVIFLFFLRDWIIG